MGKSLNENSENIKEILNKHAAEGWHLFPAKLNKDPYTYHGFKDATQTHAGIDEYIRRYPGCQWAGWFPGQFIIDIDIKKVNGFESLARLESRFGKLPQTRTHKTGSGGKHFIYRQPQGYSIPKADPISKEYPGVDLQANGSYILLPPSRNEAGPYEVIDNSPVIDAPVWLCEFALDAKIGSSIVDTNIGPGEKIPQGQQNDWLFRRARAYRGKGDTEEQILEKLKIDLIRCDQDPTDPFTDNDLRCIAHSAMNYAINNSNANSISFNNTIREENGAPLGNSLVGGQSTGQSLDNHREKGELSQAFDRFLSENPEPHWKKEVAEMIGTTYKDESFIKLVQRRKNEGAIRVTHEGDKIQWVNKEWQRSIVQLDSTASTFTNLLLPFGAEKYISIPEHSQIVVAGDIGSGKTHWGYLFAELNSGIMPIRHFFNEIGASKAKRNLEDFPNLLNHHRRDYFLVDLDKEGIDVVDNLDPNGLNIYDYLHLSASKEWFLILQHDLTRLSQKLEKGCICVMLQKKRNVNQAMGGDSTRMQCEVYFTLNIEKDEDTYKQCHIDIEKAKDWVTTTNPETLCCRYRTAPKYGKLEKIGDWERKPQ